MRRSLPDCDIGDDERRSPCRDDSTSVSADVALLARSRAIDAGCGRSPRRAAMSSPRVEYRSSCRPRTCRPPRSPIKVRVECSLDEAIVAHWRRIRPSRRAVCESSVCERLGCQKLETNPEGVRSPAVDRRQLIERRVDSSGSKPTVVGDATTVAQWPSVDSTRQSLDPAFQPVLWDGHRLGFGDAVRRLSSSADLLCTPRV